MVDSLFVEVLRRNNGFDNVFSQVGGDLFVGDFGGVLNGDQDGVNSNRDHNLVFRSVFNGDLNFGVRSDPSKGFRVVNFCDFGD